jgi:hypothetical protein
LAWRRLARIGVMLGAAEIETFVVCKVDEYGNLGAFVFVQKRGGWKSRRRQRSFRRGLR